MKKLLFTSIFMLIATTLIWGNDSRETKALKYDSAFIKIEVRSMLDGHWDIQKLNGIDIVKEKAGGKIPFLEFHLKDSAVSGNTGCNTISGKAIVTDEEISFNEM